MTAQVIYLEHVLTPQKRRIVQRKPQTIRRLAPNWQRPYIALLNGEAVLRAEWGKRIKHGDVLAFVDVEAIPQGGGGDGGSNPVAMIAMIAVMTLAPMTASWMMGGSFVGPGMAGFAATGFMGGALTMGVGMVGAALVNALIPPPKPPTPQVAAALAAPSPTYNLQAQGNQARMESAIPEHFGRSMAYLDFAAQPYMEYAGNEQYLYQLLCVGRGEYDIEAIRLEDTLIANFDEITYETIAPNGSISLFPANVISSLEVSGQSPDCRTGTYSRSGTTVTVTLTGHGLTAGKSVYLDFTSGTATDGTYSVVSAPTADTFTVTDTASGTTSGNVTVSPWVGGFIASAAGTSANYIGIDYVMGRGIYYVNANGSLSEVSITMTAEARTVDADGSPTSSWATLGTPTYTAATTTPQRYSERYSVTAGRYEVRVRRVDAKQTSTSYGHDVAWAGMRAYLPETRTFGDATLLAMRMKASNNLSMQGSRKINVIATRKLPIWNGSTWSANTATRSIAWPIAYACKQMGLTDAQIDLATLLTLDATWAARGDYFDGRFDSFLSFWEAVTKMAAAGRAKPYMQGGIVRIMRDQAASIPVALFSVRNIVKGSFSIDYLMPTADTADAIDVGYFDKYVWAPRRVRAKLPGSTAAKPVKVEMFGVTEREQAFREGMYQAASNRYRRRIVKFATEMEGFIPSFGDLIAIQHDMPAWGYGGEVTVVGSGQNLLKYSQDFSSWTETSCAVTADSTAAPDGTLTADTLTDATTVAYGFRTQVVTVPNDSASYVLSVYVKKTTGGTAPIFGVNFRLSGGTAVTGNIRLNTDTGGSGGTATAIDMGDYWHIYRSISNNSTGNTECAVTIYPAIRVTLEGADVVIATGSAIIWGMQLQPGTTPTDYIRNTSSAAAVTVLTLSDTVQWVAGTNYLALRKLDGSIDGPYIATEVGINNNQVALASAPAYTPYTGTEKERTHYAFGNGYAYLQARVLSAKPRSLTQIEIEAVNEDSNVHTAETGQTAPVRQVSQLASYTSAPEVLGLTGVSMPNAPEKMLLMWQPSQWADHYLIEQSSDGEKWTRAGESTTANYTATALYGANTLIRVAAVGMARGPWVQINYGLLSDYMWAANDTTLMWNADSGTAMWTY